MAAKKHVVVMLVVAILEEKAVIAILPQTTSRVIRVLIIQNPRALTEYKWPIANIMLFGKTSILWMLTVSQYERSCINVCAESKEKI